MRHARAISHTAHVTNGSLAVVIVAHIDTGPLWYQWIARAGHHAWLWYGNDPQPGIDRLVRETSPDVVVVDAPTLDDAAWRTVESIRGRFGHARLRILAVSGDERLAADSTVHCIPRLASADALVQALWRAIDKP